MWAICCNGGQDMSLGSDYCTKTNDNSTSCQSNCGYATEPSCASNNVLKRVVGYYESWATDRACDSWRPNDIAASSLTHLNYAFALFEKDVDGDWALIFSDDDEDDTFSIISEFISLKNTNPGLSCFLSIGGWSFNDPPTASYWSDMASTADGRKSWSKDVLRNLELYGFDGVDLDWEYPAASDRGGSDDDTENYVLLITELRKTLDASGKDFGISFTVPSSYWYLRGFNVAGMINVAGADWMNIMTYDLHGVWDGDDPYIGAVLGAHTNLTEIKEALDLLWKIDIDPSKVILGFGFYGRSFQLSDGNCIEPGCPFSGAGTAGDCTATAGILSYKEIMSIVSQGESVPIWSEKDAVMYMTYDDGGSWISFDNNQTFQQKVEFANNHCLGGVMIWAVDLDTYDWQALSGLLDKSVDGSELLSGGSQSNETQEELATAYSAYTGTDCYVTECVDVNKGQCKAGYSVLEYVHAGTYGTIKAPDTDTCKTGTNLESENSDAQYRLICCPTQSMPESCIWGGGNDNGLCTGGGSSFCGEGKYELIQDSWTERWGAEKCVSGARSLCCNSNTELELCSWTSCGGSCPSDKSYANKYETLWPGSNLKPRADECLQGDEDDQGELALFCCPAEDTYKNCEWLADDYCTDSCPSDKVLITQRQEVVNIAKEDDYYDCLKGYVKLCCDPPDATTDWPVDPAYLFEDADEDDVSWYYNVEEDSNELATGDASEDPFAIVMIDGDESAYDESLVDQWSFLDSNDNELKRRGARLSSRDIFAFRNDTFENVVENYRIRCGSSSLYVNGTGCQSIFIGGARNTIVKMPTHIGAGPYARVISLEPINSSVNTSVKARADEQVYELTVDYHLAAAAEDNKGDVNFRVDYTNLLEYWSDVTDTPAKHRKRWFGSFSSWLKKVTTIVKDEKGALPLEYDETIKLFHFYKYCPATKIEMTLDLDSNIHVGLYSQYAYYFEGSILPTPSIINTYGYFSVQPAAAILMTLRGEATVQTNSGDVDIVSGLTLPGLSIKGLISIGPTFALTGSMDTSLSVSGEINAGISVAWDRTEIYFPQDADGEAATVDPTDLDGDGYPQTYEVSPTLDATISAQGNMALTLTPQVKFGISVLSGSLMEGYVTAGVTNTVSLGVNATASANIDGELQAGYCYWADYVYSVFLSADVSFAGGVLDWGDSVELLSPDAPVTLVEETCQTWSNDNSDIRRRSSSLVQNTTGSPCFGGLIECTTEEATSCAADSGTTSETRKRATYSNPPGLFYNCDWFPSVTLTNLNENTMTGNPYYTFIAGGYDPTTGTTNRDEACGGSNGVAAQCAQSKTLMWPTAVQSAASSGTADPALMNGYQDTISCDEFPFNASEEGGDGAEAACVYNAQQGYQSTINGLLLQIKDVNAGLFWKTKNWPSAAAKRIYTMSLVYSSTTGNNLGKYAGQYSSNNVVTITNVLGGLNLFGNSAYTVNKNAVCLADASGLRTDPVTRVQSYVVTTCIVEFDTTTTNKRNVDFDPGDPGNWQIKSARLSDDWKEDAVWFEDGTPLFDDQGQIQDIRLSQSAPVPGATTAKPTTSPRETPGVVE
ncbi:Chitotriosidase-1 [Cytospora mali]|uniref:chitinase n=1 Tax=Cytospora mali TaxID=578113 RepID=A0A194W1H6_CYTMA|nr:Chitotriosidase-1 [Valsa mali]